MATRIIERREAAGRRRRCSRAPAGGIEIARAAAGQGRSGADAAAVRRIEPDLFA